MNCPKCNETATKHGKTRDGQQRFRCKPCKVTFSEPKPLPGLSTGQKTSAMALKMLCEGMSIRATARMTGLDKDTVQRIMEQAGWQCFQFMADTMQELTVSEVQVDEVWSFVGMKEKTAFHQGGVEDAGDCYTYTAVDRHTKLLIAFHCGLRTSDDAHEFSQKLAGCVKSECRPHVSTDGFRPYHVSIQEAFGYNVDHGMVVKEFGSPSTSERRRYSPAKIIGIKHIQNSGKSKPGQICTSHVERHNLTIRMQNRRFTRLTNAFSKKWENHEIMFALFAAWYNFCRPHMGFNVKGQKADPTTPAMKHGLTDKVWTMERLLTESAKAIAA